MLSLALPTGQMEHATLGLFERADLKVVRSSQHAYHASIDDPRIEQVKFLRPHEIASYVERGAFDLGITGRDWIAETDSQVVSLHKLCYSDVGWKPVDIVLAVPGGAPWQSATDLPDGVRISTEYPALTHRFLDDQGIKAEVVPSLGATKAKAPDIVDAIVDAADDLSLHENGLKVLDTVLTGHTELIANQQSCGNVIKRAAMHEIATLLNGAGRACEHVLIKFNVTRTKLPKITGLFPEKPSVTVIPCIEGRCSVELVLPKKVVNIVIPELKGRGAEMILEIPLAKMMER